MKHAKLIGLVITERFPDVEVEDALDVWDRSASVVTAFTTEGALEFARWGDEYAATLRTCDIIIHRSNAWRIFAPGAWSDGVAAEGEARSFTAALQEALGHVVLAYELESRGGVDNGGA